MQFEQVHHTATDRARWVFAMTKWEATALTVIGKNKKAPLDEQAVRFDVRDGQVYVWSTDMTQLLVVQPRERAASDEPSPPDYSFTVTASELKSVVAKSKASEMLYFPTDEPVVLTGPKAELVPGGKLVANDTLGELRASPPLDRDANTLRSVLRESMLTEKATSTTQTIIAGRFAATLAAVAKATADAEAWLLCPPADAEAPVVLRVGDDDSGARWTLVLAPLAAVADPPL